jgi:hypothetical protein
MRGFRMSPAFLLAASIAAPLAAPSLEHAAAQAQDASPDAKKPPALVGSYSLVTTSLAPAPTTHLLNPPLPVQLEGGTEASPQEYSADKTVPPQYAIEGFGNPRYDCIAAVARLHGCDALDRTDVTVRDANTVGFHIVTHGAAVQLQVNLEVHDILPISQSGASIPWHALDVIFVTAPKPTPSFHFVSEVLAGDWNGEAIVFEIGKDLPPSAKKGLEDLGIRQDLGDSILYSYRVKDPAQPK